MARILAPSKLLTTQPFEKITVNSSNPITKGLIFAYTPTQNDVNIVTNKAPIAGSAESSPLVQASRELTYQSSTTNYKAYSIDGQITSSYTLVTIDTPDTTTSVLGGFISGTSAGGEGVGIKPTGSPVNYRALHYGTALTAITTSVNVSTTKKTIHVIVGTPTDVSYYIDSKLAGTAAATPLLQSSRVNIGGSFASAYATSKTSLTLVFNRSLSPGEVSSLSADPWQVFKDNPLVYYSSSITSVTGSLAITNANDTLAASGTTTIVGSLARTNSDDTLAASGTTTIVGSLARTNSDDTLATSGTVTIVGSLARTNANDTLAASGTTTIVGSLARTNANDTVFAYGLGPPALDPILGTVDYTNANDTLAASGTTTIVGSLARTNANDTLAASGTTNILGVLFKNNNNDASTATGTTTIIGTVARTHANDTLVASGSVGTQPIDFIDWILYARPGKQVIINQKTR